PCLVWHCLSHPLSPQAHSSRIGAEWVCIYYFLFSFTLASVYLSTKWPMESFTGLRELRDAPPGLAGQPPCRVRHCLSHPLSPQAQLSRTGAERVCIYYLVLIWNVVYMFVKIRPTSRNSNSFEMLCVCLYVSACVCVGERVFVR